MARPIRADDWRVFMKTDAARSSVYCPPSTKISIHTDEHVHTQALCMHMRYHCTQHFTNPERLLYILPLVPAASCFPPVFRNALSASAGIHQKH